MLAIVSHSGETAKRIRAIAPAERSIDTTGTI
jgi:hypothetical protein